MSPSPTPTILVTLLEHLKIAAPQISSFTIKLSERKITIVPSFINRLIEVYGIYLKKLAFLDCSLENESIKKICKECPQLERLAVSIPIREAVRFTIYLDFPLPHPRFVHLFLTVFFRGPTHFSQTSSHPRGRGYPHAARNSTRAKLRRCSKPHAEGSKSENACQ